MPQLQLEQRTPEWLAARVGKVTASLAAACIGRDPHKGALAAFNAIMGKRDAGNKHTAWGVEFEQEAREAYECVSGNLVTTTGFWVHPSLPWLGASPDGLVNSEGLVEIKCPSILPEAVPEVHLIQMQVQMEVTERRWCDYFAWSQNGHFLQRVPCLGELEDDLMTKLKEFYETYVATNTAPPRRAKQGAA